MSPSPGFVELLCLVPVVMVMFLVPLVTLLLVFATYRRLERVEESVKQLSRPQA